jgi:hypothetical protein
MNERRRGEDMRSRRDQEFDGGRDMGQGRGNRGSQWRDQGDGDFAASRRGDDWEREAGFNGQSDNRYDEGADSDRYGDYGQGRQGSRGYESGSMRGGSRQSMSGGYGTSNEGYGNNRGMSGSWGSQGWSGESGGMQRFGGNGGQQGGWEYRNRQGFGGDQGYGGGYSGSQGAGFGGNQGWGSSQGYGGSQGQGRMEQSRYSGMGPKGYQRSDDRIREDVSDRLTDDGSIDASEIEVDVKGGEVTLSGTVADREQKRRAEDIAESCSGVTNVTNNIRCQDRMRGSNGSGKSAQGQSASGQTGSSQSSQGQSASGQQSQSGKKNT